MAADPQDALHATLDLSLYADEVAIVTKARYKSPSSLASCLRLAKTSWIAGVRAGVEGRPAATTRPRADGAAVAGRGPPGRCGGAVGIGGGRGRVGEGGRHSPRRRARASG